MMRNPHAATPGAADRLVCAAHRLLWALEPAWCPPMHVVWVTDHIGGLGRDGWTFGGYCAHGRIYLARDATPYEDGDRFAVAKILCHEAAHLGGADEHEAYGVSVAFCRRHAPRLLSTELRACTLALEKGSTMTSRYEYRTATGARCYAADSLDSLCDHCGAAAIADEAAASLDPYARGRKASASIADDDPRLARLAQFREGVYRDALVGRRPSTSRTHANPPDPYQIRSSK